MRANAIKSGIVRPIRYHMYHYGIIISYKLSYIAETVQTGNRNRVAAEIIQIYVTLIVEGHDLPVGCRSSMHRLNGFPPDCVEKKQEASGSNVKSTFRAGFYR